MILCDNGNFCRSFENIVLLKLVLQNSRKIFNSRDKIKEKSGKNWVKIGKKVNDFC